MPDNQQPVKDPQRTGLFRNTTDEVIPSFAVMEVTDYDQEKVRYLVQKPTRSGGNGFLINGPSPVNPYSDDDDGSDEGIASLSLPTPAAWADDGTGDAPVTGEVWGPRAGTWTLSHRHPGFKVVRVLGDEDAHVALVAPMDYHLVEFVEVTGGTPGGSVPGDYLPARLRWLDPVTDAWTGPDDDVEVWLRSTFDPGEPVQASLVGFGYERPVYAGPRPGGLTWAADNHTSGCSNFTGPTYDVIAGATVGGGGYLGRRQVLFEPAAGGGVGTPGPFLCIPGGSGRVFVHAQLQIVLDVAKAPNLFAFDDGWQIAFYFNVITVDENGDPEESNFYDESSVIEARQAPGTTYLTRPVPIIRGNVVNRPTGVRLFGDVQGFPETGLSGRAGTVAPFSFEGKEDLDFEILVGDDDVRLALCVYPIFVTIAGGAGLTDPDEVVARWTPVWKNSNAYAHGPSLLGYSPFSWARAKCETCGVPVPSAPPPPDPPPVPPSTPVFSVAPEGDPPPGKYTVGTQVTFSENPTNAVGTPTYTWTVSDGTEYAAAGPTHTFADVGTFYVTLRAVNGDGQTSEGTVATYEIVADAVLSKSASYSMTLPTDIDVRLVKVDATLGAVQIDLPPVAEWPPDAVVRLRKTDAGLNNASFAPAGGDTINGAGAAKSTNVLNGTLTAVPDPAAGDWTVY